MLEISRQKPLDNLPFPSVTSDTVSWTSRTWHTYHWYIPSHRICYQCLGLAYTEKYQAIRKCSKCWPHFVVNDYAQESTVTNMILDLKWPRLQQRRQQANAHRKEDTIPLAQQMRGWEKYMLPTSRANIHLQLLFPDTVRLWNRLPLSVLWYEDVDQFKVAYESIICMI